MEGFGEEDENYGPGSANPLSEFGPHLSAKLADDLLEQDLREKDSGDEYGYEPALRAWLNKNNVTRLTQNQYDACVIDTYQRWIPSGTLATYLKGNFVASTFSECITAFGGNSSGSGNAKRRYQEADLFHNGNYHYAH